MIVSEKKGGLWHEPCVADNYEIALNNKMNDDDNVKHISKQTTFGGSNYSKYGNDNSTKPKENQWYSLY